MSDRFHLPSAWAQRLTEFKIPLPALLRRAGLPEIFFQQEKIYATTAQVFALWRAVREMTPDPAIGLKMGEEPRFGLYHPTTVAAVCSQSFRDALHRIARFKQLTCPQEIRVLTTRDEASVEFIYPQAQEPQPDILGDLVLSWILGIGRRGTDGRITPLRLELTRPVRSRELLESHFGCRVRFKASRDALVFRNSDLDLPFITHNVELLTAIGAHLESELQERNASADVGGQVKHTLKRSLAGKRPTLQQVARDLCMSVRTLQRRLTDADITFRQLVEDTRREMAHHYLKHSTVELNEAAFLLGYEDANSFIRAFHVWEGTSPGEWRTRHSKAAVEVVGH
ncbi:MAG: AraC family transcriptional regulator ligand-binding domain-containing protein [Verrucomicrobiota bacterium]|jgi:AraC-like DNA-binding protein